LFNDLDDPPRPVGSEPGSIAKFLAAADDLASVAVVCPQRQAQGFDHGAPARAKLDVPA
jgi:hypothetical protein